MDPRASSGCDVEAEVGADVHQAPGVPSGRWSTWKSVSMRHRLVMASSRRWRRIETLVAERPRDVVHGTLVVATRLAAVYG
jgi:hypothetical protein